MLSLIAAIAEGGVIGAAGGLPWRLPEDLKHFRRLTLGKPVVMGRKTFASLGRPLPQRVNIVLSRDPSWSAPGVLAAHSLEEALALAKAHEGEAGETMIIGGAALYAATLPLAERLYLTRIQGTYEGDTFFPPLDPAHWRETCREEHPAEPATPAFAFCLYEPL